MLTPRENAASVYGNARALGRGKVLGADMAPILEERLAYLRTARRVIEAARGTERRFLREPDDVALDRMLENIAILTDVAQADRGQG